MSEIHKLIDSHCHLDMILDKGISEEEVFSQMQENRVEGFVQISTDPESISFTKKMSKQNLPVAYFYTIGHHPNEVNQTSSEVGIEAASACKEDPKFVAIGEIGLDYYYTREHREAQIEVFEKYMQLAVELGKPVCIHTRDAHDDTFAMLRKFSSKCPILIHCFTGNRSQMEDFLSIGCFISFSGIVTFKNASQIQEAATFCPDDKILVETDAPFLAPTPFRGKTNQPGYVRHTLDHIAGLRNQGVFELGKHTYQNTKRFYNLN